MLEHSPEQWQAGLDLRPHLMALILAPVVGPVGALRKKNGPASKSEQTGEKPRTPEIRPDRATPGSSLAALSRALCSADASRRTQESGGDPSVSVSDLGPRTPGHNR